MSIAHDSSNQLFQRAKKKMGAANARACAPTEAHRHSTTTKKKRREKKRMVKKKGERGKDLTHVIATTEFGFVLVVQSRSLHSATESEEHAVSDHTM